jgi:homocitrate synthase NifV
LAEFLLFILQAVYFIRRWESMMYLLADQTVDEALRTGTGSAHVESMILALQKYPVDAIDVSLPHWKSGEISVDQGILQARLRCRVAPVQKDIIEAAKQGFKRIIIQWSQHPDNVAMGELAVALAGAKVLIPEVSLAIENASRFSADELLRYQAVICQYDVDGLIYQDQDSILEPFETYHDLKELQQAMPCPLEFHAHNNLGLATANTLAALRAGVRAVGVAVGGVGLPGHAAMEEVLMAVLYLWKQGEASLGYSLAGDCEQVLSRMGIELAADKAIIGSRVFYHESGIHVDGVNKNPSLYEAYQPEAVGLSRSTIIGKHSGTGALKQKFLGWNITLSRQEAARILEQVRKMATAQKGAVSDQQLQQIYSQARARQLAHRCAANKS